MQLGDAVNENDRSGIILQWHCRWAFTGISTSHAALNKSAGTLRAPLISCLLPSAVSAVESRENYTVVQRNLALELVRVTEVRC